jgi:hypothetical protein
LTSVEVGVSVASPALGFMTLVMSNPSRTS